MEKKTPCLDYFQRIPFSSRDVVESLHLDLLVNLPAAAEDFEIDCNNLNLRLGLTFEQASDLLKTIQGELLAILEDDSIFLKQIFFYPQFGVSKIIKG